MSKQSSILSYFKSPRALNSRADEPSPARASPKATTPKRAPRTKAPVKGKENNMGTPTKRKRVEKAKLKEEENEEGDGGAEETEKEETPVKAKKIKFSLPEENSDEDSGDDYKPDPNETISESECSEGAASSSMESATETDEAPTPQKKSKREPSKAPSKSTSTAASKNDEKPDKKLAPTEKGSDVWQHLTFEFLAPENIRDAKKRRPDHPDYNPKTLYVPEDFLNSQTPAMRQWWVLKSQHFDCILFFKVGKFYELYHMDAVVSVNELNISYMKGDWAHSGFPEMAYARFSGILVEKGYKVARIEQTETPDVAKVRKNKFEKVVKREICQISNRSIRCPSVQDSEIVTPHANYLLAIVEKIGSTKLPTFGVCFVDTTTGVFRLGQFADDLSYSRLLTLLSHCNPTQVIYERGGLSTTTMKILNDLPSTLKEALQKDVEFWSATKTLQTLKEADYFKYESTEFAWPDGLQPFLNASDTLGLTPAEDKELAINALGGCVSILKQCLVDEQLLAQKNFQIYVPPDMTGNRTSSQDLPANMVLDAITVNNLNILGKKDSLFCLLDHTCTAFGKRLLKEWVCRPSCQKNMIVSRQGAITELLDHPDVTQTVRKMMAELPDLERLLSKIHAHGNAARIKNHPDGRAILFEVQRYTTKKIEDFITVLQAFDNVLKIRKQFDGFENELIKFATKLAPEGEFPDLKESLDRFKGGFDPEEAKKAGYIVPKKGIDPDFDEVTIELAMIRNDADAYLEKQRKHFGVKINFTSGADKKRYQIDVPESRTDLVTPDYQLEGQRKGFKRYWTAEALELVDRYVKADEKRDRVLKDANRRVFANFSTMYDKWCSAVYKIAVLDALISLAEYAKSGEMCVPEFVDSDGAFLAIKEGKHPCVLSESFVSNDTILGTEGNASLVIVTGPNMGGKSTLMRQVGLLSVMAQIGCHIPAESCKLTMVDRVFTRLGAGDDILTSRSTFLVELTETSVILKHATKNSLVLLDELGRGTSTYDGTAIAAAVANALTKVHCRTLFSTHYHTLVEDFKKDPNVSLAHMACQVETEEEEDVSEETVTFLYKFVEGDCPKSYGFNAAKLAGVPQQIIKRAHEIADQLERETNRRKLFVKLWKSAANNVSNVIDELKSISL